MLRYFSCENSRSESIISFLQVPLENARELNELGELKTSQILKFRQISTPVAQRYDTIALTKKIDVNV